MAKRPIKAEQRLSSPSIEMSVRDMKTGVVRLSKRLNELTAFDVRQMQEKNPPELTGLEAAIEQALAKTFGNDTSDFRRFSNAASLRWTPMLYSSGQPMTPLSEYQNQIGKKIERSRALLAQAIKSLEEDVAENTEYLDSPTISAGLTPHNAKVFVVHGHDEGARETIARFLERLGFEAIILHEQANQGRTIIEKIEVHGDVGFAVVLLTPDDFGGKAGDEAKPRARQNVVLELGYFVGRLGREHVCALVKGELEIPSDFSGVVYEPMDNSGGWKRALANELQTAGHKIDWNKVMR